MYCTHTPSAMKLGQMSGFIVESANEAIGVRLKLGLLSYNVGFELIEVFDPIWFCRSSPNGVIQRHVCWSITGCTVKTKRTFDIFLWFKAKYSLEFLQISLIPIFKQIFFGSRHSVAIFFNNFKRRHHENLLLANFLLLEMLQ